jgi:excisionase family DNA binding protein
MTKLEITPREAARVLGIRLDSVYSLLWSGKLRGRIVQGKWRIPSAAVQERAEHKRVHGTAGR